MERFIEELKRRAADGGTSAWLERCLMDLQSTAGVTTGAVRDPAVTGSKAEQDDIAGPSDAVREQEEDLEVTEEGAMTRQRSQGRQRSSRKRRARSTSPFRQRQERRPEGERSSRSTRPPALQREPSSQECVQPRLARRDYRPQAVAGLRAPGATDEAGPSHQDPGQTAVGECGLPQRLSLLVSQLTGLVSSLQRSEGLGARSGSPARSSTGDVTRAWRVADPPSDDSDRRALRLVTEKLSLLNWPLRMKIWQYEYVDLLSLLPSVKEFPKADKKEDNGDEARRRPVTKSFYNW